MFTPCVFCSRLRKQHRACTVFFFFWFVQDGATMASRQLLKRLAPVLRNSLRLAPAIRHTNVHLPRHALIGQNLAARLSGARPMATAPALEIINIQDEEDFQKYVIDSSLPVVVDFHASWVTLKNYFSLTLFCFPLPCWCIAVFPPPLQHYWERVGRGGGGGGANFHFHTYWVHSYISESCTLMMHNFHKQ